MTMIRLDKEEKEILAAHESGKLKSVRGVDAKIKKYMQYAKNTLRKDKRINIRLSQHDLEGIRVKALQEGIPYQTLIASVLHKYVIGRLIAKAS